MSSSPMPGAMLLAASSKGSAGGSALTILLLVGAVGLAFVLSRQSRRRKAGVLARSESALVVGTEVLTRGGIIGMLVELTDTEVVLRLGVGIEVRMLRGAIAGPYEPSEPAADSAHSGPDGERDLFTRPEDRPEDPPEDPPDDRPDQGGDPRRP